MLQFVVLALPQKVSPDLLGEMNLASYCLWPFSIHLSDFLSTAFYQTILNHSCIYKPKFPCHSFHDILTFIFSSSFGMGPLYSHKSHECSYQIIYPGM